MDHAVPATPVNDLADRFWQGFLELQPVYATVLGDERWDDRLDDPGPDGRAAEQALLRATMADADSIDQSSLPTEERITLDMLRVVADLRDAAHEHRLWQIESVDPLAGPQSLPSDLARFQRLDSPERVDRAIARLAAFPRYLQLHIDNIREGAAAGRTAALPVVERTITQTRRIAASPGSEAPLILANPGLTADDRERLAAAVDRHVRPALGQFLTTLEDYRARARTGDGLCWLPDGDALYRFAILASTTLLEEPRALHDYGLERIGAIDREREAIARAAGFRDVAAYRAQLDADPTNVASEPAALVRLAEEQVERVTAAAPAWFGRLPRATCQVRAVEAHQEQEAPPAFYLPPATDGSRPGTYFINTYDPASRALHRIASTTYHEAVPGHHFQIAIEAELEGLPAFRRLGSRLTGAAYPEGWGLYSERLADEMGLYLDDRERFGMLDAQAWRAARLVVDTGLHAFRWDRQQSIDLLRAAVGLSQLEAETETDRYIGWPGQALAYMSGQRVIEALRAELSARHGSRFDLRVFHDEVLGHGALPLATLQRELPEWVSAMA